MNIFCLGVNHRTAPIEARERLWCSEDELRSILPNLRQRAGEVVLVSTCNRTELYYVGEAEAVLPATFIRLLDEAKGTQAWIGEQYFYHLTGTHAVKHLFGVAAGRDSMVLGDIQILNQIKTAFAIAQNLQTIGPVLNRLFTNAIHTGKRTRTETGIAEGAVSVGYAAAELASKIFHDLSQKTALLIGAGETGTLTAKHLHAQHLGRLLITNRTRSRAEELLAQFPGVVIDFDNFAAVLPTVDIIISSIGSSVPILSADDFRDLMQLRRRKPLLVIDLGMPRNIDPATREVANVFLHDIDDLFHIVDNNLARRQAELFDVNTIILDEVKQFSEWYRTLRINPTIQELRGQFEAIRSAEVERSLRRFPPEMQEEVAMLTKRIVNKILHVPTVNLRAGAAGRKQDETQKTIHLLRSLFALDSAGHRK